ncbi:MAG: sulfotransferase domain-containing protein, partial [Chloroflexota bacterium]
MKKNLYRSIEYRWRKLLDYLYAPAPILVNSVPKSGTNLLKNIVHALPHVYLQRNSDMSLAHEIVNDYDRLEYVQEHITDLRNGVLYTGHIPYAPVIHNWLNNHQFKHILIYRDPRAVTVSGYRYLEQFRESDDARGHMYYELFEQFGSDSNRLLAYIEGVGKGKTDYHFSADSYPHIGLIFD